MVDLKPSDVRPFLPARNFDKSKDFYIALGWALKWSDDNLALLQMGDHSFYLQRYYVKEWSENSMLHITVEDARSCFEQISDVLAGGRFPEARVASPKEEPYGAIVTYVWDPSGVLLHLAQWVDE